MPDKNTYHRFLGFGMAFIFIFAIVFLVSKVVVKFPPASDQNSAKQSAQAVHSYDTGQVQLAGQTLSVELARTPAQQQLGLSGRTGLAKNAGMLFVFGIPAQYGFWMKDMNFPLDIMWFDVNGKAIFIQKNLSPSTYPKIYTPPSAAKYVLEVNAGFADTYKLKLGDTLTFLSMI